MARKSIVDEVVGNGGFAHGHTYAGNPMACAVGLEVFRIIREERLPENAAAMGKLLKAGLKELEERYGIIGQVRGKGLLLALELVKDRDTREPFPAEKNLNMLLTDEAYDEGLIIYPRRSINGLSGDHVLVAPPLILKEDQVAQILDRLDRALKRTMNKL
jgi:adenosylmethionine-8-amino-7-oxononanoate aminotransferase